VLVEKLTGKDAEIYEFLIRRYYKSFADRNKLHYIIDTGRVNFLTFTPPPEDCSKWEPKDPPDSFFDRISDLKLQYKKPSDCEIKNGYVFDKKSGKIAWLNWYTIIKWIDKNTVEVEEGCWSSPLGGGASKTIYKKVNGQWKHHKSGESWVS
jgi:hypothetical protein